jgi:hypothetical protein
MPMPRWLGGTCLELVQAFNDRYLECLARTAQWADAPVLPDIVRAHRRLWMALEGEARYRASRCPFVLADLQFGNAEWWSDAQHGRRSDRSERRDGMFPWIINMEMARDALTVAWYTAREDICLGTLLIGMSAEVGGIVAKLSLHELWQFADRHHHCLRPRCENREAFWGRLLRAAVRDDRATLHDLHRHAFLLADADYGRRAIAHGRPETPRN